jgi:hypothetical protein
MLCTTGLALQVHHKLYQSPLHCIRLTLQQEGAAGLTRGFGATLAREVPGNALFFVTYEVCCPLWLRCCFCASSAL